MKIKILLPLILQFSYVGYVAAKTPQIRANDLVKQSVFQDGPNCFNASLISLGYTDKKIYSSIAEISYYLQYHCKATTFNPKKLEPNSLLTYRGQDGYLEHSAVALSSSNIVEKNSLNGSKHKQVYGDKAPGRYLVHNLNNSIFFGKQESLKGKAGQAFRCEPDTQVLAQQQALLKDPDLKNIAAFKDYLAELTAISDSKMMEKKLNSDLLEKFDSLNISQAMSRRSGNTRLDHYKLGLIESAAYQWNLLNCSDAYAKYDECYAPQNQKSIMILDRLYEQIYQLRQQVKIQ